MKEFIEKLIGRLEELKASGNPYDSYWDEAMYRATELVNSTSNKTIDGVIEIVNQLAEEYRLFGNPEQSNNGWIPVSERLPELTEGTECFKQSKCCLVTLKWWDGDMTESVGWYNQSGVWSDDSNNCKVLAWQPLPEPYQPKGE